MSAAFLDMLVKPTVAVKPYRCGVVRAINKTDTELDVYCGRYLAYGTSMDYMYEELHVPYPLTVEVSPESQRPSHL